MYPVLHFQTTIQNIMSEFPPFFIWSPKHSKHVHRRTLQDDQVIHLFAPGTCHDSLPETP